MDHDAPHSSSSAKDEGELYRRLFDHAHDAIIVLTPGEELVLQVNHRACELYGFSREEFLGRSMRDIAVKNKDDKVVEVLETGHVDTFETVHRRADGTLMHLEVNGAIVDFDGQAAILSINRDVTQRHEAEQALVSYSRRLRISNAIARVAVEGGSVRQVCDEAVRLLCAELHASRASVVGLEPEGGATLLAETGIGGIFDSREQSEQLRTLPRPDPSSPGMDYTPDLGTRRERRGARAQLLKLGIRSVLSLQLIFDGRLIGELNLASRHSRAFDASAREFARSVADELAVAIAGAQSRDVLSAEQERLQALLDELPEGVLLLDAEAHVALANPRGREALHALRVSVPRSRVEHLGGYRLDELTSRGARVEMKSLREPEPYFEVQTLELTEPGGRTSGYILVLRDTTEERAVREKLREHDRLAAVGQLAAGIAHDFNNLLQTISTCVELAIDDEQTRLEQLETIRSQTARGAKLIRQILDFSRRSVTTRQPTDLSSLLHSLSDVLRHSIPENIALDFDLGNQPLFAHVDPTQIQQVVTNLCVNARDAMPSGGMLQVSLRSIVTDGSEDQGPGEGRWLVLEVGDDGTGIPEDILPHVIEPFYSTKSPDRGTGLGLSQVYGIVHQHEGSLEIASPPSQGTTVTVYLPRIDHVVRPRTQRPPSHLPEGATQLILVVEDDPVLRRSLNRLIRSLGYRTITASNGSEGATLFEQHRHEIHAVLTDLVMPGIGGVELCRRVKLQSPRLPIVVMSGYPPEREAHKLEEVGVERRVSKPFTKRQIARALDDVLRGRAARPASDVPAG